MHALRITLKTAGISLESAFDSTRIDDYAFGITRAAGIIAETGSVVIKESSTPSRLAALAPWIHITLDRWRHMLLRNARRSHRRPGYMNLTLFSPPAPPRPPMSKAFSSKECSRPRSSDLRPRQHGIVNP
jgi:hypothetical protein